MRRVLAALALTGLTVLSGCRMAGPQRMPAPAPIPAAMQAADLPELAGGPEFGGRPHEQPPNPPLGAYMSGDPRHRLMALTFDDGPDDVFTPQILDILKQNGVRATFFLMGRRAWARPELVRRIVAEGHEIGNHTWNHPQLTKLPPDKVRLELGETDRFLRTLTGKPVKVFRPPYGDQDPALLREATNLGYSTVLWNIDSLDWKHGMTRCGVLEQVLPNMRPGAIVLEHSAGGNGENLADTVQALPIIIKTLRSQGYTLVTVSELLGTGNPIPGQW